MKFVLIFAAILSVCQCFYMGKLLLGDDVLGDITSLSKSNTEGIEKRQNHNFTVQMLFRFADSDGDGKLTASELAVYTKPKGGRTKQEQARLTVQTVDTDGDNKISRAEMLTFLQNNA